MSFLVLSGGLSEHELGSPRPTCLSTSRISHTRITGIFGGRLSIHFQFPEYAEVQMKPDQPCWFDLFMPVFKARLYCSYMPIRDRAEFDDMVKDAYTIAGKINETIQLHGRIPYKQCTGCRWRAIEMDRACCFAITFSLSRIRPRIFSKRLFILKQSQTG